MSDTTVCDEDFQLEGWDWTEDKKWGERTIPRVTEVKLLENSTYPTPPIGWHKVISYDSCPPVSTLEAACWILCMATVQQWERDNDAVRRAHMVCRDQLDRRILVVAPELRVKCDDTIETLNSILCHCSCGGYECIEHTLQHRAALLFARRNLRFLDPAKLGEIFEIADLNPELLRWADLTIPERAMLVYDERLHPEAINEDRHWLDVIKSDSGLLDQLAREFWEAAAFL